MARPRTPTARKILAGNPGKRRLPRDEPKPSETTAEAPLTLPELARAVWNAIAPELVAIGCLTSVDRHELEKACRYEALSRSLLAKAEAELGKSRKGGGPPPALWGALKAGAHASVIFGRFGITPAERAKLSVAPTEHDNSDPIEQLRQKRQLRVVS